MSPTTQVPEHYMQLQKKTVWLTTHKKNIFLNFMTDFVAPPPSLTAVSAECYNCPDIISLYSSVTSETWLASVYSTRCQQAKHAVDHGHEVRFNTVYYDIPRYTRIILHTVSYCFTRVKPEVLYNLGSGSWLPRATTAHYAVIHCPQHRSTRPTACS